MSEISKVKLGQNTLRIMHLFNQSVEAFEAIFKKKANLDSVLDNGWLQAFFNAFVSMVPSTSLMQRAWPELKEER